MGFLFKRSDYNRCNKEEHAVHNVYSVNKLSVQTRHFYGTTAMENSITEQTWYNA